MNRIRVTAFRVWSVVAICALLWPALLASAVAQAPATQDPQPQAPTAPGPQLGSVEEAVQWVRQQRQSDWAASMRAAIDSDPSTFAQARRLADVLKVNLDDAVKDFDFLRQVESARRQAKRELALATPEWSRAFEDPEFANMSTGRRRPADPDEHFFTIIGLAAVIAYLGWIAGLWHHRRTRLMVFWQLLTPGLTWILYPALQVVGRYENQSTILAVVCAASPTIVTLLLCLRDAILGSEKPADTTAAAAQSPAPVPPVSGDGSDPAG